MKNNHSMPNGKTKEKTERMNMGAKGGTTKISSDADYNALPSGATFIGPDGKTRRKP